MTPEETKQAAAVMAAFDPKRQNIQWTKRGRDEWQTIIAPGWDWTNNEYRIAPEPMEVEVWVHENGSIRQRHFVEDSIVNKSGGWTLRRATIHPETK